VEAFKSYFYDFVYYIFTTFFINFRFSLWQPTKASLGRLLIPT